MVCPTVVLTNRITAEIKNRARPAHKLSLENEKHVKKQYKTEYNNLLDLLMVKNVMYI